MTATASNAGIIFGTFCFSGIWRKMDEWTDAEGIMHLRMAICEYGDKEKFSKSVTDWFEQRMEKVFDKPRSSCVRWRRTLRAAEKLHKWAAFPSHQLILKYAICFLKGCDGKCRRRKPRLEGRRLRTHFACNQRPLSKSPLLTMDDDPKFTGIGLPLWYPSSYL